MVDPTDHARPWTAASRVLHAGMASGTALVLDDPLSLWGGLDPETGDIIDARHPQSGARVTGRVLVMPSGRGSSSSSTILAEAVRAGTAPAAIVLLEPDEILVLGALVAEMLDDHALPVVQVDAEIFSRLTTGDSVEIEADGTLRVARAAA